MDDKISVDQPSSAISSSGVQSTPPAPSTSNLPPLENKPFSPPVLPNTPADSTLPSIDNEPKTDDSSPQPSQTPIPSPASPSVPPKNKSKILLPILAIFLLLGLTFTIFQISKKTKLAEIFQQAGQYASLSPSLSPTTAPGTGFCGSAGLLNDCGPTAGAPCSGNCTHFCHDTNYTYCCWDNNHNGVFDGNDSCSPGSTGNLSCSGYTICNNTNQNQTYFYVWGAASSGKCSSGGYALPGEGANSGNLNPGQCFSIPSDKCGQLDFQMGCGVCKDTGCGGTSSPSSPPTKSPSPSPSKSPSPSPSVSPSPSPSITGPYLICTGLSRNPDDTTAPSFEIDDSVTFSCACEETVTDTVFYNYRIRTPNSTDWTSPTGWQNISGDTPTYTIQEAGSYTVQCQVCTSATNCTDWGQQTGWQNE